MNCTILIKNNLKNTKMNTKERIKIYLNELKIGQTAFELQSGLSRGMLSQKNLLGEESLLKIAKTYPELNLNWLIRGEGEMTNKPFNYNFSKIYVEVNVDEEIKKVLESKLEKRRDEVVVLLEK